jgi:hypothetical protein
MPEEPTVKLKPDFKIGETIVCKSTDQQFKILAIKPEGLVLQGRAGIMPASAARKKS